MHPYLQICKYFYASPPRMSAWMAAASWRITRLSASWLRGKNARFSPPRTAKEWRTLIRHGHVIGKGDSEIAPPCTLPPAIPSTLIHSAPENRTSAVDGKTHPAARSNN